MANKQPRRQRCEPKIYTESDMRRIQRQALMDIGKHQTQLYLAAFGLTLHRTLGLTGDQIADILVATNEYSHEALCFQDARKELLEETGLDLDDCTGDLL